jgi:3-deoxy-D-manno-octulosonate 8-phosphate phosphatase (KDO 8-P phosphatase)
MSDVARMTTDPARVNRLLAIVCDVDGTLTDGGLVLGPRGDELKRFDVRDGLGTLMALRAGLKFFFLSSRLCAATRRRARELGVTEAVPGHPTKVAAFDDLLARHSLKDHHVCYVGDDLTDLVLVKRVSLGVAVADAHELLRRDADLVAESRGGHGAVREIVELILQVRGDWERIVRGMDPDFDGKM